MWCWINSTMAKVFISLEWNLIEIELIPKCNVLTLVYYPHQGQSQPSEREIHFIDLYYAYFLTNSNQSLISFYYFYFIFFYFTFLFLFQLQSRSRKKTIYESCKL